jgi:hypothetical protein
MALTRPRAYQIYDIDYKQAVRVITVSNISLTLGAPNSVDGVNLSLNDRILVAGQSNSAQNGIYYVTTLGTGSNGTWARSTDTNTTGELLSGTIVMVTEGATYADTSWKLVTDDPITIGSTGLVFELNTGDAFGTVNANGTSITANTASATLNLAAGDNISIVGNNTSKTATISVTGISLNSISNGTSNVTVVSSGGNVTVGVSGSEVAEFSTTGLDITGTVTASGNVTGGNVNTTGQVVATGNLNTAGQVVATGNITGGNLTTTGNVNGTYLLGNVFYATGISASKIYNGTSEANIGTSGGNANISIGGTSNVAVIYSGGVAITGDLSVTGNATLSGNILGDRIQNGTTSFDIQTANGNANITVGGTSNVVVFSSAGEYVTGIITATGNIAGSNILGNGRNLTGINTFATISVSGQSDVVADSITDTLTFAAGTGIAITTDAGNDIITISSAATDSIFATGGDMGTIDEAVTSSEELGEVTSAPTVEYDLGTESTSGIITPSLLLLPSYTVAELGSLTASPAGQFVFCTNESGGSIPAFSDGTNWRRVTDRAIVS